MCFMRLFAMRNLQREKLIKLDVYVCILQYPLIYKRNLESPIYFESEITSNIYSIL